MFLVRRKASLLLCFIVVSVFETGSSKPTKRDTSQWSDNKCSELYPNAENPFSDFVNEDTKCFVACELKRMEHIVDGKANTELIYEVAKSFPVPEDYKVDWDGWMSELIECATKKEIMQSCEDVFEFFLCYADAIEENTYHRQ